MVLIYRLGGGPRQRGIDGATTRGHIPLQPKAWGAIGELLAQDLDLAKPPPGPQSRVEPEVLGMSSGQNGTVTCLLVHNVVLALLLKKKSRPPTAIGCPLTAAGCSLTAVDYSLTAVGYSQAASGNPPTAVDCPSSTVRLCA